MELPSDFKWRQAASYAQIPDMICLGSQCVARINQRADDLKWYVVLDRHLDDKQHKIRQCATQWTGRAGMEQWVIRHQDRLRQEVAAILAAKEAGKIRPAE
ncbi:hypothetical protein [Stenotrophomonas sp. DR009]|uniref:hypothetical protein n=1 Tax=Stenotrophomonas sp. DR009 TaxID=3398461 RepID=UPI003BB104A7